MNSRERQVFSHDEPQEFSIQWHLWISLAKQHPPTNPLTAAAVKSAATAKPGCETKCGNVTVPFPFGIGINSGCSINPLFDVSCGSATPKLLLPSGDQEITDISVDHVRIKNKVAAECYTVDGRITRKNAISVHLTSSPYSFSSSNIITVVGCDDVGLITTDSQLSSFCAAMCLNSSLLYDGLCDNVGCCHTQLPKGQKSFDAELYSLYNHTRIHSFDACGYAFVGDQNAFQFHISQFQDPDFENRTIQNVPIVLDWAIGDGTCDQMKKTGDYACRDNTSWVDSDLGLGGYRCYCMEGYEGNPYLYPGCTDIDECKNNPCSENGICTNTPGNYTCSCLHGYDGDGRKQGRGCIALSSKFPALKFSIGFSVSFISVLMAVTLLYFGIRKRKLSRMREKFFIQNGGLLLKQKTSFVGVESTKIFSAEELEKATNRYSEGRVLGRGGYGTVYKGTLLDQRVVAIKKSRIMDKSQIEPFINEVIILTQINHRNVVKLLGCCIETEIPLLVYEFISNGTLYDHIHNKDELSRLPWKDRFRIAAEAAGALAYLHSAASVPVIHRDVKLSNILLDHSYTAKLSDFGVS